MPTVLQITQTPDQAINFMYKIKEMAIEYAPKLVGAVLVYLIGSWIINKLSAVMKKAMALKQYDPSLQSFLTSLVKVLLTVLLILTIFGMLGVNLTAFGALLAGVGIAIGAALNGSLGNFAGGVMLLTFKPFKMGDLVEAQGQTGIVKELGIFNTVLLSPENKTIILANGALSTGTIINYTTHGNLRVDTTMAIAPDQDIDKAKQVAIQALLSLPEILKTPSPEVNVLKVGDGMITLAIRPYAMQENYWLAFFGGQEAVKKAWDKAGINGPVPHVVHINK
ncbi:mechanosensitive ion channel family protein [Ferruginibacter lapsinanis]|uniref:mechanosensitive ion channel family protein n=1 Tax=Ferruginibacter lapsinanis TaxID=563172 RepID=UPI001E341919|nr:mechanosensitive ion channel family protein [Ferruginibacter lapsinanis]UEG48955.1 mechanosensitive ion channel family protein [Ferruginibacter lapsinanis]